MYALKTIEKRKKERKKELNQLIYIVKNSNLIFCRLNLELHTRMGRDWTNIEKSLQGIDRFVV